MNGQRRRNDGPKEERTLGMTITFEQDGHIHPDLLDGTAQKAAKIVADCRREANKPTQLRRFYDELVMWQGKVRQQSEQFPEYLPFIRMLKAKAAYARGRNLVDGAFVDLLEQMVNYIDSEERLNTAKLFFEAFIGFYKQLRPKD